MRKDITNKNIFVQMSILFLLSVILTVLHLYRAPLTIWGFFSLWCAIFISATVLVFSSFKDKEGSGFITSLFSDKKTLVAIVIFSGFLRFIFLKEHPYISIHDEMRDCGNYALEFFENSPRDPFGFGFASGYGNFPPFLSTFFYPLFGVSFLLYRVPCAIVGVIVCVLTYLLGKSCYGKRVGVISALCISVLPIHLFFSRVELVVLSDSLMGVLLVAATWSALQRLEGFFAVGLVYGLCFHFYAASRAAMVASAVFLVLASFPDIFRAHPSETLISRLKQKAFLPFMYTCMGTIIGLGPTLNFLTKETLFSPGVPQYFFSGETITLASLPSLIEKAYWIYLKSILTIVYEHFQPFDKYPSQSPLLLFPLNFFFIIGAVKSLASKFKKQGAVIIFFVLFIPLFVQVLPNRPFQSYRILTLVPLIVILASLGIKTAFERVKSNIPLITLLIVICCSNLYVFFIERPSDNWPKEVPIEQPFQAMLEYAQSNIPRDVEKIIYMSNNHSAPHHREKVDFMLYKIPHTMLDKGQFIEAIISGSHENRIFLGTEDLSSSDERIKSKPFVYDCNQVGYIESLACPNNFTGIITFFVYDIANPKVNSTHEKHN